LLIQAPQGVGRDEIVVVQHAVGRDEQLPAGQGAGTSRFALRVDDQARGAPYALADPLPERVCAHRAARDAIGVGRNGDDDAVVALADVVARAVVGAGPGAHVAQLAQAAALRLARPLDAQVRGGMALGGRELEPRIAEVGAHALGLRVRRAYAAPPPERAEHARPALGVDSGRVGLRRELLSEALARELIVVPQLLSDSQGQRLPRRGLEVRPPQAITASHEPRIAGRAALVPTDRHGRLEPAASPAQLAGPLLPAAFFETHAGLHAGAAIPARAHRQATVGRPGRTLARGVVPAGQTQAR